MQDKSQKDNTKSSPNLFNLAVKGGVWVFTLRIVIQLLSLARLVLVVNKLPVAEMGLLGVALLMIQSLNTFTSTGFGTALIQKNQGIKDDLDTAWTIGLIRAIILFAVLYFAAPYLATLKVPDDKIATTAALIRVLGLSFIIGAFTNIGTLYFQKEIRFGRPFIIQTAGTLTSIAVSIIIVLIYKTIWSLVLGRLCGNAVTCLLSYVMHPFRPKLHLDLKRAKKLWSFGKWVFGATIIGFLFQQGDDFFVWGYLGISALAFYQLAYKFSNIPATEITHIISQVSFPAYSKLQNDIPRLRDAYMKVLQFSSCLSIPIAALIFILTPEFVTMFLKPKWLPIIPAMQILAIFALLRSLAATTGPIFQAVGRPDIITKANFGKLLFMAIIIYPLTRTWGFVGTSTAILSAALLVQPVVQYMVMRVLKCSFGQLFRVVAFPFAATILMLAVIVLIKFHCDEPTIVSFMAMAFSGVFVYTATLLAMDHIFGYGIIKILKEQLAVLRR